MDRRCTALTDQIKAGCDSHVGAGADVDLKPFQNSHPAGPGLLR